MGGLAAVTGCSALSPPQQSLLVAVNNFTPSRRDGRLRISYDGTELVNQYLEVPAAGQDSWGTVETELSLGSLPEGATLGVTAAFGDGLRAAETITLECGPAYRGDAIYVQLEAEVNVRFNNACYDAFPSGEAVQGGVNRS